MIKIRSGDNEKFFAAAAGKALKPSNPPGFGCDATTLESVVGARVGQSDWGSEFTQPDAAVLPWSAVSS